MKSAKKGTSAFGNAIKSSIKNIVKMGLAMFGVRSAFMAFRKAANAYMESNEKLKNQMDSLWNIAGQAIGPVIEWLIQGISTLVMWVDSLVQSLSGVSLVAKANAAALNKQASAAKSASLAGFDEMNKLSDNSGSKNTGLFDTSLAGDIPQFLENIKQQILSGDWYGAGATAGKALMDGFESLDWNSIGTTIGEVVGSAISFVLGFALNLDPLTLLDSAAKLLTGLIDGLSASIQSMDWSTIGSNLIDFFISGLITSLIIMNPFATIIALLFTPTGQDLASSSAELIGSIIGALLAAVVGAGQRIGELATETWNTIKEYFTNSIDWSGTPEEIINGLWEGIKTALKDAGDWIYNNIWVPFRDGFKEAFKINSPSKKMKNFGGDIIDGLWSGINGGISKVKEVCTTIWTAIKEKFSAVGTWFKDKFSAAASKISTAFTNAKEKIKEACSNIWTAIKEKFSNVGTWFKDKFSGAWQKVKDIFSSGGETFEGIKEGVSSTFKDIVNNLIGGINTIIPIPFNKINSMLNTIRDISVLGVSPFKNMWGYNPLSVPQIPKLARGGIVNRPGRGVPAIIGEAGPEAVLPLENNTEWMDMLAEKIGGNVTIPIYMDGKKIATYVVDIQKKKAFAMNGA